MTSACWSVPSRNEKAVERRRTTARNSNTRVEQTYGRLVARIAHTSRNIRPNAVTTARTRLANGLRLLLVRGSRRTQQQRQQRSCKHAAAARAQTSAARQHHQGRRQPSASRPAGLVRAVSRHASYHRPAAPVPRRAHFPPSAAARVRRCICQHIDRYPKLNLPTQLAQRVLSQLAARTWLDRDTLARLQDCELLSIELPDSALVDDSWMPLIAKQPRLVRLDLSGSSKLTDAALATLPRLRSLSELNISNCPNITDAGTARRATPTPPPPTSSPAP